MLCIYITRYGGSQNCPAWQVICKLLVFNFPPKISINFKHQVFLVFFFAGRRQRIHRTPTPLCDILHSISLLSLLCRYVLFGTNNLVQREYVHLLILRTLSKEEEEDDDSENVCKKINYVIASIWTCSICQMQATCPTILFRFKTRNENSSSYVHVLHKTSN